MSEHRRLWRTAVVVLLLVAVLGPWTFDLANVPSQYPCSAPSIRLEGDFCGWPLSGIWILSAVISGLPYMVVELVTGAMVFADRVGEVAFGFLALLLVLPFFSTLLLILRGDRRRRQVLHTMALGLAVCSALLIGIAALSRMGWALWGIGLYIGVAASGLILEVLMLIDGKETRRGSGSFFSYR